MRSLTAHLIEPAGHGHLPFHPSCPVCAAERLDGRLPADELLGPRPTALLAATVLAGTTLAPTAAGLTSPAVAAQEETDDENTPTDGDDPTRKDGDGDGGLEDSADPPLDLDDTPAPTPDPVTPTDPPVQAPAPLTPEPPAEAPTSPPESTPPAPAPTPQPGPPPEAQQETPPGPAGGRHDGERHQGEPHRDEQRRGGPGTRSGPPVAEHRSDPTAGPVSPAPAPPPAPAQAPAATGAPATPAAPTPISHPGVGVSARPGPGEHVVRPGECLWSIAADQLGADATPAAVARMVNRLWQLNAGRIATGNPDLILVGTTLELP